MCATCGCSEPGAEGRARAGAGSHSHPHPHPHEGAHSHAPDLLSERIARSAARGTRLVRVEQDLLAKNDAIAATNRAWLAERGILALNLVSSPGAGKTALLERTLRDLKGEFAFAVIEGDQETPLDADRIRATGVPAVQVNTGRGCHLDAEMVAGALQALDPRPGSVLLVENVGNLVCPAMFDLGEHAKVVVASTPEGAEKPLKYPHMFRAAALVLLNKIDLAPLLAFDADACIARARAVNPRIEVLPISATRGDGLERWYAWLRSAAGAARGKPLDPRTMAH